MISCNSKLKFANLVASLGLAFIGGLSVLSLGACVNRDAHITKAGATFYVDSVVATFSPNQLNPNDAVNQKFMNLTACLKDNAMTSVIMNVKFTIHAGNVSIEKQTDDRGCLIWQELFEYDPTDNEKQVSLVRNIEAAEGHYGAVDAKLSYNPWKDDFLFLRPGVRAQGAENLSLTYSTGQVLTHVDAVTGQKFDSRVDIKTKLESTIKKVADISSMSMKFLKRDFDQYEISPTLALTIAHQYRLRFNSFIVKHTLDKGAVLDPLNAGRFKFYFVLLGDGYDSNKTPRDQVFKYVVSSTSFEAAGSLGRFVTDVTLKFDNIAALASRMTGVITMEPLDQGVGVGTTSFEGIITPIAGAGAQNLDLLPSSLSAKDLSASYAVVRAQNMKTSGLDILTRHSRFMPAKKDNVTLRNGYSYNIMDAFNTLRPKFDPKDGTLKPGQELTGPEKDFFSGAFCYKYFDQSWTPALQKALDACNTSKTPMIAVNVRELVDHIVDPVPKPVGIPQVETLAIASGVAFGDAREHDKSRSVKADATIYAGVGAEFDILKTISSVTKIFGLSFSADVGAKASINGDAYYLASATQTEGQSTIVGAVKAQAVVSEAFKFQVQVASKTCLFITPTAELEKLMGDAPRPEGKFICDDQVQIQTHEEMYYFLNESTGTGASPLSDNMSSEDNPWRMFIRGSHTYGLFANLFTQKNLALNFEKMPEEQMRGTFKTLVTQEFPGMLTPPNPPAAPDATTNIPTKMPPLPHLPSKTGSFKDLPPPLL